MNHERTADVIEFPSPEFLAITRKMEANNKDVSAAIAARDIDRINKGLARCEQLSIELCAYAISSHPDSDRAARVEEMRLASIKKGVPPDEAAKFARAILKKLKGSAALMSRPLSRSAARSSGAAAASSSRSATSKPCS
jgi:hypothetical protein